MADSISIKMSLDGEADLRRAIAACNSELKNMKSALKLATEESRGQANTLAALERKQQSLNDVISASRKKESELETALKNANKNYAEAGTELDKYGKELKEAEAELKRMQESGKASNAEIKEQESKVVELQKTVSQCEAKYQKAGISVQNWETKLNNAKTETARYNNELSQTEKYLDEAKNSEDKCAKSIDEMGKEVKGTAEELERSEKETGEFSAAIDSTTKATTVFADSLQKMAGIVRNSEAFKASAEAVSKIGDAAYSAAKELDVGYDTIVKKTGATGDSLQNLYRIADETFSSMPVSMEDVGKAVGELNTRFTLTGDETRNLSERFLQFARLNETDVSDSVDQVQNAMAAFGIEAKDAGQVLDVLNLVGQNTGTNVGNLATKLTQNATALQEMGMDAYQAATFMGQLETAGTDTESVMSGLKRALKNATEGGKDLDTALANLQDEIENGTDSTDGLTTAYDLFGRSGAGVFQAVKNGQINFKELANSTEILEDATNSVKNTYDNTISSWDKATVASNNLKSAGSELTSAFFEAAAPAMDFATDALKGLTKGLKDAPAPIKNVVGAIGGIVTVGAKVAPTIIPIVSAIKQFKVAKESVATLTQLNKTLTTASGTFTKSTTKIAANTAAQTANTAAQKASKTAMETTTAAEVAKTAAAEAETATDIANTAATEGETVAETKNAVAKQGGAIASGESAVASGADAVAKDVETASTIAATSAQEGLNTAMSLNPVGLLVLGIGALVGGLVAYAANSGRAKSDTEMLRDSLSDLEQTCEETAEEMRGVSEASETLVGEALAKTGAAEKYADELAELADQSSLTAEEQAKMRLLVGELNTLYPEMGLQIDSTTGKLNKSSQEIKAYVENLKNLTMAESYQKAAGSAFDELVKAEAEYEEGLKSSATAHRNLEQEKRKLNSINNQYAIRQQQIEKVQRELNQAYADGTSDTAALEEKLQELSSIYVEVDGQTVRYSDAIMGANAAVDAAQEVYDGFSETLKAQKENIDNLKKEADGYIEKAGDFATAQEESAAAVDSLAEAEKKAAEAEQAAQAAKEASITTAGEELAAWGNLSSGLQEYAANMAQNVQSMTESIAGYSQSVGDWFSVVEEKSDVSYQTMVDNLQGQVDAMTEWEQNMAKLAENGIDRGLLQYLSEMGPKGAGYVQAMVDQLDSGSEEGISKINEVWEQKLKLEEGVNDDGKKVIAAVARMGDDGEAKFNEIAKKLNAAAGESGKNTVLGLVNGIQSAQEQARQAAEQAGEYATEGLANGVLAKKQTAVNAAVEVAEAVKAATKSSFKENSPSKVFDEMGQNLVAGLVQGIKKQKANAKKSATELAQLYVSATQERISYYNKIDKMSAAKEAAIWKAVLKQTKKGTKAYRDAYANYYQANKKATEEARTKSDNKRIAAAEQKASKKSLAGQVEYWKKVRALVKKGSDAYKTATEKINEAKKNIASSKELAADYKQGWQEVKTNLVADIQEVTKAYDEAVKSRKNALTDSMSLFDYFKSATLETPAMLISKLQSQVDGLNRFNTALDKLSKKSSVPKELIEQLQEMGPQETANIELLAKMDSKQLKEYVKLWKEKNKVAEDRAKQENQQLLKDSEKQVKALIQQANKDLTALEKEYNKDLKAIGATAKDQSKTIGANIVKGITSGINSKNTELTTTLKNLCKKITNTTKDALKIKSPSRVFRDEIGKYLALGLTDGFEKNLKPLDFSVLTKNVPDIRNMMKAEMPMVEGSFIADVTGAIGDFNASMPDVIVKAETPNVYVNIGNKELAAVLSNSVIKNISGGVRAYAAAGGR